MRLKRLKPLNLKKFQKVKDNEGGVSEGFSSSAVLIEAEICPARSKRQVEIYGPKINDILNMNYQGEDIIEIGDGLCVYVSSDKDPDYRVISKKIYTQHQVFEIEKR